MSKRKINNKGVETKQGRIVYTYKSPGWIEAENENKNIMRIFDPKRKRAAQRRQRALGHTGPMPWLDSVPQGGNPNPKRRKKEYPSGHHNCGFYRQ